MRTARVNLIFVFAVVVFLSVGAAAQSKLPASKIRTIYITPTSHYDLGFVEPPDQVRERAARHIDQVIRIAEANPDFRWTIESVWQVEEWLKRQRKPSSVLPKDKEKIARLMTLIKSGQIALSTAWGSMHTDFMGAEELNRICYGYTALHSTYGINSELALMDDVPGHPTSIPSVLAASGTKYLVTGANLFLQDATSLAPGKVPFYWESPDGNRVLTWISAGKRGGYIEALTDFYLDPYTLDPYTDRLPFDMFNPELAGKKSDIEVMEIGVTELLNRYNNAGYAYDAVMVMYAHDFLEPDNELNLLRAAQLWNKTHPEVQLRVTTANDFFKYIEGKYASQIPTYRGEWSGLWSEAKTRSPRISALARYAHDNVPAGETLWSALSMTRRIPAPSGNFSRLYDLMYGYDEHSGAGNNGWPQLNSISALEEQNRQYVRDMKAAYSETDRLLKRGVELIAQPTRFDPVKKQSSDSKNLVVYNPSSWVRDDVVRISPPEKGTHIAELRDERTGKIVPFDTETSGEAVFVATQIPALGYSAFAVRTAAGEPVSTLMQVRGSAIFNEFYTVSSTADGHIASVREAKSGRELVNTKGERPFNDLLRIEGSAASVVPYPVAPKITIEKGTIVSRITVRRDRSIFPISEITLYKGIARVDLHNELDPEFEGFVGGEKFWGDSYYFAFPFNIGKDGLKIKREGQKWFDTLPDDYLPGARRDSVSTQHSIALTDGSASAVVAHRQAFHWTYAGYVAVKPKAKGQPEDFPAMYTGSFPLPEATVYSRALRNASEADTHDRGIVYMETVEPGIVGNYVYDYSFSSEGAFDPVAAWRLGHDINLPLRAEYTQSAPLSPSAGYFSIDQPNVQIVDVKPLFDSVIRGEVSAAPLDPPITKVFIIRLQEFAGRGVTASLKLPVKLRSADVVNTTEDKIVGKVISADPLTVKVGPFQTVTIRVEIE
ncbi:MAG: hypothetical protein IT172_01745 [Acidobacteria bacterium]|nr:hypothetical protein [Acidobacteriota bacterium]